MRWIFRIIGAVALVAVLAVAALFLIPTERVAALVADQMRKETGRSVTFQGEVRPSLWPELGITTGPVTVSNAAWSDAGPMLQAEGLAIGIDTAALWGGAIRVTRIEALSPEILLERHSDGRANWEFGDTTTATDGSADAAESGGLVRNVSLDRASVSDGRVTYVDHGNGARVDVSSVQATARLDDLNGPGELDVSAQYRGQAVSLTGEVAELSTFLTNGASKASASGKIGGSGFSFDGKAGLTPLAFGGAVDVDLTDQASVFGLIGAAAPDLPRGFGQRIQVTGQMTFADERLSLREARIQLDQNILNGAVDVALAGAHPKVTASLSAGTLDFSSIAPEAGASGSSGSGEAAASTGWSKDAIDVSGLQSVDADIALAASGIDLGVMKLDATRTRTTLDAGRAVTEIKELAAYGGAMSGSFVLNSRGGLSARATMAGDGVAVQSLLKDLMGYDRLIANGDVRVNVLAIGNSMDALMRSLDGTASMTLGKGELLGLDLVGMLRNLDPGFVGEGQRTIFDGLSASVALGGGFARNDDLVMDARLVKATGQGSADLGAQTLDYRMNARLLEGDASGGLGVPIIISGPWSAPKFRLDLEALAKQEFGDEIEEVKQKAEEVILNKIEEETGVKVESLGEVEDALKDELGNRVEEAIQNEVGNALNNLFNR